MSSRYSLKRARSESVSACKTRRWKKIRDRFSLARGKSDNGNTVRVNVSLIRLFGWSLWRGFLLKERSTYCTYFFEIIITMALTTSNRICTVLTWVTFLLSEIEKRLNFIIYRNKTKSKKNWKIMKWFSSDKAYTSRDYYLKRFAFL